MLICNPGASPRFLQGFKGSGGQKAHSKASSREANTTSSVELDCKYFGACSDEVKKSLFEWNGSKPVAWKSMDTLREYGYSVENTRFYACPQQSCMLCPVTVRNGEVAQRCDDYV